ncbi:uncharacterized protein TNCV_20981 [Trichonephila clavipes]|uniref:Uncharacterized protein n=1 Tax=Trichonephila clavipes TaxID=2585209 RepID=A0A8X6RGT3_TRICX|nr:uncharacterized protein TNCV_20981 [Trichonephila clavipes]
MIETFTTGSPHTNTTVITAKFESGFVTKDDLVPFHCSPVSSGAAQLQTDVRWVSRVAHAMGAAIPNVLQPSAFVWFEKTQRTLVKALSVSGWRPMKQLAVRVHFVRCSGLFNDWSVEGVLSLVFV